MKLVVVTPTELTRDPRARRAAVAAMAIGVDVVGLCPASSVEPTQLDGIDVIRSGSASSDAVRVRAIGESLPSRRAVVRELRGVWRLGRLVRLTIELVRATRGMDRIDIVHANDLDSLPAAWRIARIHRARLVYDAHELYTSQEPNPPRIHRYITGILEGLLGRRADEVVTVNDPIADELQRRLRLRKRPLVVLNCPNVEDVPGLVGRDGPLQVVYQGAMGPGRFTDDLLSAAELAPSIKLTLRVAGADLKALQARVDERQLEERVHVVPPVAPDVLVKSLVEFEVGVIINRPVTLNDELVLPNKLFEYLMAGLAVVAPELPALTPVLDGVGATFRPGEPADLAATLIELAGDRDRLLGLRREARRRALSTYNAEVQAAVLQASWGL
jgi:glycogen synthase